MDLAEKVPFWQFFDSGKMALLNPCMKFKNLKLKQKTEIFSKRTHKISKILFNLGSYKYLASLECKIRRCPFFDIHNYKKAKKSKHFIHLRPPYLTCPRIHQIQDLGTSIQKTEIFSKRTHKISKILFLIFLIVKTQQACECLVTNSSITTYDT